MRANGIVPLSALVIIIVTSGCDNVAWGGIDVELRPPDPSPRVSTEVEPDGPDQPPLEPLDLGSILYVVERGVGSEATLLPVAEFGARGYRPLPGVEELPDLVERFPLGRWEEGTEFVLLERGVRVGTFTSDGSAAADTTTCRLRPYTRGRVELAREAPDSPVLLALRKGDLPRPVLPQPLPGLGDLPDLQTSSVAVARALIPRMQVPWPPSIPGIRRHHEGFMVEGDRAGLAASFIYDGELAVGAAPPFAYSLFFLAREEDGAFQPFWAWYQQVQERGKAFPRFLGAHDLRDMGAPDALLEVFGEEDRWFVLVGLLDGSWEILHQDPCGVPTPPEAVRTFPG